MSTKFVCQLRAQLIGLIFLFSCASTPSGLNTQSSTYLRNQFKKICLEGSGKGRIELAQSKYVFEYESLLSRQKNLFELALDFPVIGQSKIV